MLNDEQKYQNIISQIHELNRQNLLAESERSDIILNKLNFLEKNLTKNITNNEKIFSDSILKKAFFILIVLLVINIFLNIIQLFNSDSNQTQADSLQTHNLTENNSSDNTSVQLKQIETINSTTTTDSLAEPQNLNEDVVTFDQNIENIPLIHEENETYEEIKPIIKKDTIYVCEDDNYQTKYKIPYTVEIKGKLYNDKFEFILQNNSSTKKCKIDKIDI